MIIASEESGAGEKEDKWSEATERRQQNKQ
jgi:hypothetical protein